jgi:tetratricopeptide (TPR) repeat protein
MWYNTYPYWAYYYTGRYQDVIDLADTTLNTSSERILEESFYWRGMAKLALADTEGAIADFKKAVEVHPGFIPAIEQLQALGINP